MRRVVLYAVVVALAVALHAQRETKLTIEGDVEHRLVLTKDDLSKMSRAKLERNDVAKSATPASRSSPSISADSTMST
jgi:hypothetical protein